MRLFDTARSTAMACPSTGSARRCAGWDRDSYALSTKVGRLLRAGDPSDLDGGAVQAMPAVRGVYDYSYDGVLRSVDDSLQRLGMHRIDMLLIHDVDVWTHGSEAARQQRFGEVMAGGYRAMLRAARAERVVRAIGAGINEIHACEDFAARRRLRLLPARRALHAARAGGARHPPALLRRARHLAADRRPLQHRHSRDRRGRGRLLQLRARLRPRSWSGCAGSRRCARRHRVRLASAALQFPLGHPNVAT